MNERISVVKLLSIELFRFKKNEKFSFRNLVGFFPSMSIKLLLISTSQLQFFFLCAAPRYLRLPLCHYRCTCINILHWNSCTKYIYLHAQTCKIFNAIFVGRIVFYNTFCRMCAFDVIPLVFKVLKWTHIALHIWLCVFARFFLFIVARLNGELMM